MLAIHNQNLLFTIVKKIKSLTSSTLIVVVWIKIKNLYDSLIKKI